MRRDDGFLLRAVWSGIDALSTPLTSFLVTAGLIRTLGQESYGLLVIALAASTFAMALGTGLGLTTTKLVAERSHDTDPTALPRSITASLLATAAFAAIILIAAFLFLDPLTTLVFGPSEATKHEIQRRVLILSAGSIGLLQLEATLSAGFRGLERFRLQAIVETSFRCGIAVTMVLVAWLSKDVVGVLASQCLVLAISVIVRAYTLRRHTPRRKLFVRPRAADFRQLIGYGSWMWINATATATFGTLDRVVIGRLIGSSAAAEYQIYLQLSQLIHYVPTSLFAFSFPTFSRLTTNIGSDPTPVRKLFFRVLGATTALGMAGGVAFIFCRDGFVRILAGDALHTASPISFNILAVTFSALSINVAPYYFLLGSGKVKVTSFITLASGFATLIMTLALVPEYGLAGAALARLSYSAGAMMLTWAAMRLLAHRFSNPSATSPQPPNR